MKTSRIDTSHGKIFENKVINYFSKIKKINYNNKNISYTSKWDIPKINDFKPVSIKSFKNQKNPSIQMGDILRILEINENFILFIITYEKNNNIKKVINSGYFEISKDFFNKIKENIDINFIKKLNKILKGFKKGEHIKARKFARRAKKIFNKKFDSLLNIHFKIDSKNQRRIQSSFKLSILEKELQFKKIKIGNI